MRQQLAMAQRCPKTDDVPFGMIFTGDRFNKKGPWIVPRAFFVHKFGSA